MKQNKVLLCGRHIAKDIKKLELESSKANDSLTGIGFLTELEELIICGDFRIMPDDIGNLKKLKTLTLNYTYFDKLPETMEGLESLEEFYVWCNQNWEIYRRVSKKDDLGFEKYWRLSKTNQEIPDDLVETAKKYHHVQNIYSNYLKVLVI